MQMGPLVGFKPDTVSSPYCSKLHFLGAGSEAWTHSVSDALS